MSERDQLFLSARASKSASAKADPIELRIYAGANGDFNLYEDEGDNYDYEHGAHSVIPMHWDDKAGKLTIGDRQGSFPGMLEHRTFHIVRVADGHGTGIAPTSNLTRRLNTMVRLLRCRSARDRKTRDSSSSPTAWVWPA